MDMTKYYWEAKDENEALVIAGLLRLDFGGWSASGGKWGAVSPATMGYIGYLDDLNGYRNISRTLATIDQLVEWALRGFKDPWEVAPEGYRLVTDEERENYSEGAPPATLRYYIHDDKGWVPLTVVGYFDGPQYSHLHYAVPLDFTFQPKVVQISAEDAMRKLREIEGCEVWIV